MKKALAIQAVVISCNLSGCASVNLSLADQTARAIGLSSGNEITIGDESSPGIVGHKYYTATTNKGVVYNCTIFRNMGFSDRPNCVPKVK